MNTHDLDREELEYREMVSNLTSRAHQLVSLDAELDFSTVLNILINLQYSPIERLQRGLWSNATLRH